MIASALKREDDGLAYLRRVVSGAHANVPIGDTLGFRLTAVQAGHVTLAGSADARSYNLIDTVHGGWAAAVLDTAMGTAILSTLDARHDFTTLELKVNYLRPITQETGEVRATGRVIHQGRRIALCEAELLDASGKRLAHGTSTCLIVPR